MKDVQIIYLKSVCQKTFKTGWPHLVGTGMLVQCVVPLYCDEEGERADDGAKVSDVWKGLI